MGIAEGFSRTVSLDPVNTVKEEFMINSLSSAHACVTRTLASELEASARELKEKCAIHMQGK